MGQFAVWWVRVGGAGGLSLLWKTKWLGLVLGLDYEICQMSDARNNPQWSTQVTSFHKRDTEPFLEPCVSHILYSRCLAFNYWYCLTETRPCCLGCPVCQLFPGCPEHPIHSPAIFVHTDVWSSHQRKHCHQTHVARVSRIKLYASI